MKESKQLGHISNIKIDTDSPLKANYDCSFNHLTLVCGLNGSGKSLMLKINWVINFIVQSYLLAKEQGIVNYDLLKSAQESFDKTFDNQDFNGSIEAQFDKGNDIIIEINKGNLTKCDILLQPDISYSGMPMFMSTETRTYNDIVKYFKLRKAIGISGAITASQSKEFEDLCSSYKLYDILFLEKLYTSLSKSPLIFNRQLLDALKKYDLRFNIVSIGFDEKKCELYYMDDKGVAKSLTTLSKGEQSLINMLTANYL